MEFSNIPFTTMDEADHFFPTSFPATPSTSSRYAKGDIIAKDSWDPFGSPFDEASAGCNPIDLDETVAESEDTSQDDKDDDDSSSSTDASQTILSIVTAENWLHHDAEEGKTNDNNDNKDDDEEDKDESLYRSLGAKHYSQLIGVHAAAADSVARTNKVVIDGVQLRYKRTALLQQLILHELHQIGPASTTYSTQPELKDLAVTEKDGMDSVLEKYLQQLKIIKDLQNQVQMAKAKEAKQAKKLEVVQDYMAIVEQQQQQKQQGVNDKKGNNTGNCVATGCSIEEQLSLGDSAARAERLQALLIPKQGKKKNKLKVDKDVGASFTRLLTCCGLFSRNGARDEKTTATARTMPCDGWWGQSTPKTSLQKAVDEGGYYVAFECSLPSETGDDDAELEP